MVSEAFNGVLRVGDSTDPNVEHGHCTSYAKTQDGSKHAIVLDIGSNAGFYGLYAAAVGCRTYFFDIQKVCLNWINSAIDNNQFHHAALIPYPISNTTEMMHLDKQSNGCHGTFTFSKTGDEYYREEQKVSEPLDVQMVRLDDIFHDAMYHESSSNNGTNGMGPIALIKIDVEGFEPHVIASMYNLLRHVQKDTGKGTVRNIVTEIAPSRWGGLPGGGLTRDQVATIICDTIWDAGFHKVVYFTPWGDITDVYKMDTREALYNNIAKVDFGSISKDFFFQRTHITSTNSGDISSNGTQIDGLIPDPEHIIFQGI